MSIFNDSQPYEKSFENAKTAQEKCEDKEISITDIFQRLDKNIMALALANFLHREIIEEVHSKYNISQEEMCKMNRQAVNRARCFVEFLDDEDVLLRFQGIYSLATYLEWDDPIITNETKDIMKLITGQIIE